MAGCIFTIHRNFFKRLGYYDPEFKLYGAENLEISFKVRQIFFGTYKVFSIL